MPPEVFECMRDVVQTSFDARIHLERVTDAGADAGGDLGVQRTGDRPGDAHAPHFGGAARLKMLTPHLRQLHRSRLPIPDQRPKVPQKDATVPRNFSDADGRISGDAVLFVAAIPQPTMKAWVNGLK